VNPARSAKSTEISGKRSAMMPSSRFNRSTIDAGSTLRSSRSERSRSAARPRTKYWRSRKAVSDAAPTLRKKNSVTSQDGMSAV
jgi:hypothetical protein